MEENVRYCGNNVQGNAKENLKNSLEACRKDCEENDKCFSWVWFSKGSRENQCWLKGAIDEKSTSKGVFSGQKCAGNFHAMKHLEQG